jgi:PAS domain S-box-containing protein
MSRGKRNILEKAREGSAKRDERIAELERSQHRLERLYAISKRLTHFESVEQTVPEVMAVVGQALPLRSVIFIFQVGDAPQTITWLPENEDAGRLQAAKEHAQDVYGYLVRPAVKLGDEAAAKLEVRARSGAALEARNRSEKNFVMLPLVDDSGSTFGALQMEGARTLDELDLVFVNAVVNQLAIGLARHAADHALRASEAKLAGIISIAVDAIISVDEEQRIVMFNEGAQKIFGYERSEVVGAPLENLMPKRFRAAHRGHIERFAAGPKVARTMGGRGAEIRGRRKNGEEFPAEGAISKLAVGGRAVLTVVLRDVTEQRRIESEQTFLADVAAAFAATLEYEDTLTTIAQLVVRDFADMCIVEIVEDDGAVRRLKVLIRDPSKSWACDLLMGISLEPKRPHLGLSALETNEAILIENVTPEIVASWAQGEDHLRALRALDFRSVIVVPLAARGKVLGALSLASCVPSPRYGPRDLRLAKDLGYRASLSVEGARLYRAARRAVQARDDVMSVVAHDLRNPLGTILMRAALLRRSGPESERGDGKPAEAIERAATRMNRLIQDLLDVTHIEAGRLSVKRSRLAAAQIVSDSVESQNALASSASIELHLDVKSGLPEIRADRDRLLQVFENLIGNAVKFTAPGGRIVAGAEPRSEDVLFWVQDNGAGIAPEKLPHLFGRLWQINGDGRHSAGLGLPIVKGIVEAHGGRVWAESTPGHGSTFFFTIPRVPPAEKTGAEPQSPGS